MGQLDTQQEYNCNIAYYTGAKGYIEDVLSGWANNKNRPLPQIGQKIVTEAINHGPVNTVYADALLSSGIQFNGWHIEIRVAYRRSPYCQNVLIALGSKESPEVEQDIKTSARIKRACTGYWSMD
jgi:hypothetical protein